LSSSKVTTGFDSFDEFITSVREKFLVIDVNPAALTTILKSKEPSGFGSRYRLGIAKVANPFVEETIPPILSLP
jgi:hypothetical protein